MDQNLKRSVILENYQNPKNRGLIEDNTYIYTNTNNDSCIDEINLQTKIIDNIISDIRFDGEACAICTSSTSIMIQTLVGKSADEAKVIYENFTNMIEEKDYDDNLLELAVVYDDIGKQPNRKKCALLPWWGIDNALNKNNKTNNPEK